MGAYLSEPITKKESSDQVGKNVAYGASSMQGWRISQEVSGKSVSSRRRRRQRSRRARARARSSHRYPVSDPRVSPVTWPPGHRPPRSSARHARQRVPPKPHAGGERGRRRPRTSAATSDARRLPRDSFIY